MVRLLVLGRTGQLARALARIDRPDVTITCMGRGELNLANVSTIQSEILTAASHAVINAAAYTSVDQAEADPDQAFLLNRDAPEAIARACASIGVPLVHVSTDYVFDGKKGAPYVETDAKAPINVYGASKSAGEDCVLNIAERTAILRTAAVFDHGGGNSFLTKMLLRATEVAEVPVVANEWTRPTPASALANACVAVALALLDRDTRAEGVFHYAGREDATWADYAAAIFAASSRMGGPTADIVPVHRDDFPQRAKRPPDTRLDSRKIVSAVGIPTCSWHDALTDCVRLELERIRG